MPTVLRILGILWIIHTRDHGHPHVTVYKGTPKSYEAMAKIRLDQIEIIESRGFTRKFLAEIERQTINYQQVLLEAWYEAHEESE